MSNVPFPSGPQKGRVPEKRDSQFVYRKPDAKVFSYVPADSNLLLTARRKEKRDTLDIFIWVARLMLFILCAGATAFLMYQAYPRPSHSFLAWVALVPFLAGIRLIKKTWGAVLYSLFTGVLVYTCIFYWIFYTCKAGGVETGISIAAVLGLALVISIQFVLFGSCAFVLGRLKFIFALFAGLSWVIFEWLHQIIAFKFLGFPWFMLGYSQWQTPEMLQIVSYTGTYGLSFAIAVCSGAFAVILTEKNNAKKLLNFILVCVIMGGLFTYGKLHLNKNPFRKGLDSIKVSVIQPNIDQYKKWNLAFVGEIENKLWEQTERAGLDNPSLIVWPESALPGALQEEHYKTFVSDVAQNTGAYQLVGSERFAEDKDLVTAFLVDNEGEVRGMYDKIKLVPFGEYIPFEKQVRNLNLKIDVLNELGAFDKGERVQPPLMYRDIPFSAAICYESIFPALWRMGAADGSKFFVNITNDGWFLDTGAPYQHFAANVLRAVETGRPVIRSANTGISGFIDGKGRIRERSVLNTEAIMTFEVPIDNKDFGSFYAKWGDVFMVLCLVVFLTFMGIALVFSYE